MNDGNAYREKTSDILIIDDIPANLKILGDILLHEGYKVRPVTDGKMALRVADIEKPDLILLDIMMPGMDGFEVCRRFKEIEKFKDIPVIFISALTDSENIVRALTSGGVDYVTKPFRAAEVIARVNTHIALHRQKTELRELNASKDKFFSIIAHDLRSPFNGFLGLTNIMAEELETLTTKELKRIAEDMRTSADHLFRLLENLLDWSRMERGLIPFNPQSIPLALIVNESLAAYNVPAGKKGIVILCKIPEEIGVTADRFMIQTVIRNLVSNALKFSHRGGEIVISSKGISSDQVQVSVKDTGIGMSRVLIDNLFQLDGQTRRKGTEGELSTGLGLLLCEEFILKHSGRIWVDSVVGEGCTFHFTVPGTLLCESFAGY